LKPGEEVNVDKDGRLSFGGVLVVMGINSYVTKAMFDANPDHEFYVEESYPMDWMYPYLVPFGIIMRVNRQPLELTEDIMARDHQFWSDYSARTIGMPITYDTTAKELCDFAEQVYLLHNYAGFQGDRKFIRDEDAQKSFSKLRSAIGASIYQWRAQNSKDPAQRKRLQKEAEFALKQSFAYCPYSEGASKYGQLLLETGRVEDALLVLKTFQKLDPYNRQGQNMVVQLLLQMGRREEALRQARDFLKLEPNNSFTQDVVDQMEKNPSQQSSVSLDVVFNQVSADIKTNQFDHAAGLLEQVRHSTLVNGRILTQVAQFYAEMRNFPKSEEVMKQATQVEPNASQSWYNLAIVQAFQGHAADAAESIKRAFAANVVERVAEPNMIDLRENARTNPFFNAIRQTPEFRAAVGTN
jgi:tetratricopeptide (TPR) repeat protein